MQARNLRSRRHFLRLTILGAAGTAVLAACAPAAAPTPTAAPKPAEPAKPAATTAPAEKPAAATAAPAATPTQAAAATAKPEAKPTAQVGVAKSTGPVSLAFDTFRGTQFGPSGWAEKMSKDFKAKFPNVTVEARVIPYDGQQYPKQYAMFAAGTLGDIFSFDPSHWEFYRAVNQGIVRALDDYIAADKFDLTQFFEPFVNLQKFKGKIWGLPNWGWSGHDGFLLNKVVFDQAGLKIPDYNSPSYTLDDIYQAAVKLTKMGAGGRYERFGINLSLGAIGVTIYARTFGGDILNPEGNKCTVASDPAAVKGLRFIYDLSQKEKVVALPGGFEGNTNDLFVSGRVAMLHAGSVSMTPINKMKQDPSVFQMKAILFPKRADGKRPSQMRGGTWQVGAKSKNPEWAWEFVKFITNRDNMLAFNVLGGEGALTRPDILDDKFFTDNPNFAVYKENLLTAMPAIVPANFRGTEYEDTFANAHAELYLGKIGFDEGVKKLNDAVQRVLDKPAA